MVVGACQSLQFFRQITRFLGNARALSKSKYWILLNLKLDSHFPKKFVFICFSESPLQMMKNAFYFILKPLFVLKIFGHVEEMA